MPKYLIVCVALLTLGLGLSLWPREDVTPDSQEQPADPSPVTTGKDATSAKKTSPGKDAVATDKPAEKDLAIAKDTPREESATAETTVGNEATVQTIGSETSNSSQIAEQITQSPITRVADIQKLRENTSGIHSLTSSLVKALQGEYSGQLAPSAYNSETWTIETSIHHSIEGDRLGGDYSLEVYSETKGRISQTTGSFSGSLGHAPPDDKKSPPLIGLVKDGGGVILEVSPTQFMHLAYDTGSHAFVGHFYSLNEKAQTLYHGPITLRRR